MERWKILSETKKKKYKTERVKIKRVRQRERKDVIESEKY